MVLLWLKTVGAPAQRHWLRAGVPETEQMLYQPVKSTRGALAARSRCPDYAFAAPDYAFAAADDAFAAADDAFAAADDAFAGVHVNLAVLQSLPISMRRIILLDSSASRP
jgi:hypothetical protein